MSPRLRVLVVDDEPLARANLRVLLARDPDVEVVGECASGNAVLARLRERVADLVFLDVQMPRLSGLDVLRQLGPDEMPMVIFATAYDRYALAAFEAQAIDYLLKPFDDARFLAALARAKAAWRQGRQAALGRRLAALLDGLSDDPTAPHDARLAPGTTPGTAPGAAPGTAPGTAPGAPPAVRDAAVAGTGGAGDDEARLAAAVAAAAEAVGAGRRRERLLVRRRGRSVPVELAAIDWVEAADYCVRLHVGGERYLLRESMAAMARRLGERRFLRVHRSAIVRLDLVAEVRADAGGTCVLLRDGTRLPLSRRRRLLLEQRLRG